MLIGRTRNDTRDGQELRIVAARKAEGPWFDVRVAVGRSLERRGTTARAARSVANAVVPGSMTAALENGPVFQDALALAIEHADDEAQVHSPSFACPLDPSAYRDFMSCEGHFSFGYRWRGLEVPAVMYEFPVSYMGSVHGFVGPDEVVPWPHYTEHMDYELELGIVIGRAARNATVQDAMEYVAGFTILNDFSARDIQLREMSSGLGPSKGKHFGSALGPWIATPDEIPPGGARMISRINGDVWCDATSADMIWSVAELVAWASAGENLAVGTLLGSGTVNGGCGVELGRKLQPGDIVELEMQGVGILRNQLGQPESGWSPTPRKPGTAG